MDDRKSKLSEEELKLIEEGERIIEIVNSDPDMQDVEPPPEIYEKLMKQIREYEEQKNYRRLSQEDQELLRLGKLYKKRRRWNKYLIVAAALVLALGVCMSSLGGTKKVLQELKRTIAGREQSYVNTDSDQTKDIENVSEIEAYEQIKEEFGFTPAGLNYLPEGMTFGEMDINLAAQSIQLIYEGVEDKVVLYRMYPHYRTSSIGYDVEDVLVKEYSREVGGVLVALKGYFVEENETLRWYVKFEYKDVQYALLISGYQEVEVQKIIDHLYFY